MTKRFVLAMVATIGMAGAASAASATDWWLIQRPPSVSTAMFADTDTLTRNDDGSVSLRVMRINRQGWSQEAIERVSCVRPPAVNRDALGRFACASPRDRDSYGLILAAMSPQEAARMFFGESSGDSDDQI